MALNTFIDLCSGIGGGRLGLEMSGLKCLGFSDTSRLAIRTYQLMYDTTGEQKLGNLKRIKKEKIPQYDVLIAGFPCQTFSVMGRKDGFSDDRGQIIFHIARILTETQPECFILENVKGLVTHDKGNTLKVILAELDKAGYSVAYKVLTSLDYGVPQMRQRVYFVGVRKDISKTLEDFCWPEPIETPKLDAFLIDNKAATDERIEILSYYLNNSVNCGKYTVDDLRGMEGKVLDTRMNDLRIYDGKVPTLRAQRDGILYVKNGVIYQLTGYEALLLQGFPKEYADKVKDEVSDRHLLMQAGNAMTVNVIKLLGDSVIDYIESRRKSKMVNWEEFEVLCVEYLNKEFGDYAEFIHKGKSDSTIPDIQVITNNGKTFYMDVKHCPAQCGQFVLLPNISAGRFEYSALNATPINPYSKAIMEYMNADFEAFKEAGTSGKNIDIRNGSDIFANWIVSTYKNKGARYFITNDYTILPIEDFSDYFTVTAKYRIKRSGSSSVGKANMDPVLTYILSHDYGVTATRCAQDKLFVTADAYIHNCRFIFNGHEYMFSLRDGEYEVRKLSNTFNANVIFSIDLKNHGKKGLSKKDFIRGLC